MAFAMTAMMIAVLTGAALTAGASAAAARGAPESFADLAEQLSPAVVNISTSQLVKQRQTRGGFPQFPPGSPFEDFFKDFFDQYGGQRGGDEGADNGDDDDGGMTRRARSLGSGFIIDADGYVVTNNHVIDGADEVEVILHDNTRLKAEVLGSDPKTDVALLKVDAGKPLPALKWGDSSSARVGDWVLAIGNPFGLGGSVTAGIISAHGRNINAGPYDDFIQTDASINRGNSGGPLFNMAGEVIGVNTAIYSPSGGNVGIGFASPSRLIKPVLDDLRKYGQPRRGWLGVRIQQVSDEIAESLGLDKARGALVAEVTEDGPADDAGVKTSDVILSFDGKAIKEMRELPVVVAETDVDEKVKMVVWRDGRERTLNVKVGLLDEGEAKSAKSDDGKPAGEPDDSKVEELGLSVVTLTDEMRTRFRIPEDVKGLLITHVKGGSSADEKGLRPGVVITAYGVANTPVESAADLHAAIKDAKAKDRKAILVDVWLGGASRKVGLRIDGK